MPNFLNPFSRKKLKKQKLPKIIIDYREKNSLVPSKLKKIGLYLEFKQLPVADYLIGKTAIERKTISDFKSSIINKRIIRQLQEIKQYPNYFLIIEGLEKKDIYNSDVNLHENAFRGFLLSIVLEHKVPIIFTLDEEDTAKYIYILAKKQPKKELPIRASKILLSKREQLQFILEGFPNIGAVTAKKLLKHFKTLHSLANASEEQLQKIIGKKSQDIYKIINEKY